MFLDKSSDKKKSCVRSVRKYLCFWRDQPLGKLSQMIKLAVTVIERGHYTLKCNAVGTDVVRKERKKKDYTVYIQKAKIEMKMPTLPYFPRS